MFLRRCVRRKSGKRHTYWALVESYRTGRGSRQRVVAYLGELKRSEQSGWAQLGRKLSGKQRPQRSLFDPPHYEEPAADDEPVLVRLKGVPLERLRDFGDVWLALGLWRLLELHIEDTWYRQTALEDLLSVAVEKVHTDRLYTGLEVLLPCKEALEKHLRQRLGDLFDLEYDLLLYDVTSTYFEGACAANPLAKRGYSRDGRPQCLQVCIGLVVTPEWKTLAGWMQRAGLGDAPRTLLEELAKIKSGDVILPTVNKNGEPRKTIRLRCVTEPDPGQKVLLHRLGIQLPRRLRRFDELVQM